jgi:hypothetical protein
MLIFSVGAKLKCRVSRINFDDTIDRMVRLKTTKAYRK